MHNETENIRNFPTRCISAVRRLNSRHGQSRVLLCDNSFKFVCQTTTLTNLEPELLKFIMPTQSVEWRLNPVLASHFPRDSL